jgi:CubicO group peptidase (beta-lactamase class C family)
MNGLQEKIQVELFNPLGMTQNSFVWNEYLEKQRVDGHINGSPDPGYSSSAKNPEFNAAASLQSNAITYGGFLSALMSGKLLSETNHTEMLKVQSSRPSSANRSSVNYGLGIIVDSTAYGTNYAHSGDNGSATSQFLFNKKNKSGYVFFTNMESKRMYAFDANLREFLLNSK